MGPPCTAAPPPATAPVFAEVGGLEDEARATEQEHAGRTASLVHEGHGTLRTHVGNGLAHEGLILMGAGQLHQHNLVGNLRRCGRQAPFQLQQVFWGPWEGLSKERFKRGELQLRNRGGIMKQGKHSVGHLLMKGNVVCPKAMLILLLCHPQVCPLCSNTPARLRA